MRGLPHRLQRHPESLADELDALRLALEDAVAPLERTHLDTEAVGSLGGVLEVGYVGFGHSLLRERGCPSQP